MMALYGLEATRNAPTANEYDPIRAGIVDTWHIARQYRCIFGCMCVNPGKPNDGTVWFDERGFAAHLSNRHVDRTGSEPRPYAAEYEYALSRESTCAAEKPAARIAANENKYTYPQGEINMDATEIAKLLAANPAVAQAMAAMVASMGIAPAKTTLEVPAEKLVNGKTRAQFEAGLAGVLTPEQIKLLADREYGSVADVNAVKKDTAPKKDVVLGYVKRSAEAGTVILRQPNGDVKLLMVRKYDGAKQAEGAPEGFGADTRNAAWVIASESAAAFGAAFAQLIK